MRLYETLSKHEQAEIRMYGVTVQGMKEAVDSGLEHRFSSPARMVNGMLYDAQMMITTGSMDWMEKEDIRQLLNRAKWILSNYVIDNE